VTSEGYEVRPRNLPGAGYPRVAVKIDFGESEDAPVRSDRHDAVLDGEMDQLCTALQLERIHQLIFVELDGSR